MENIKEIQLYFVRYTCKVIMGVYMFKGLLCRFLTYPDRFWIYAGYVRIGQRMRSIL